MPSVTIRDVPDDTHRELTTRAARAGQSLQEYLRGELVALAGRPDVTAITWRAREQLNRTGGGLTAEQILAFRDADRR